MDSTTWKNSLGFKSASSLLDTDALSPDFPVSTPESPSTPIGYSIKYYKWGFENKLAFTYALYRMDGYSPKVEQSVANCSAILSMSKLRLAALLGS